MDRNLAPFTQSAQQQPYHSVVLGMGVPSIVQQEATAVVPEVVQRNQSDGVTNYDEPMYQTGPGQPHNETHGQPMYQQPPPHANITSGVADRRQQPHLTDPAMPLYVTNSAAGGSNLPPSQQPQQHTAATKPPPHYVQHKEVPPPDTVPLQHNQQHNQQQNQQHNQQHNQHQQPQQHNQQNNQQHNQQHNQQRNQQPQQHNQQYPQQHNQQHQQQPQPPPQQQQHNQHHNQIHPPQQGPRIPTSQFNPPPSTQDPPQYYPVLEQAKQHQVKQQTVYRVPISMQSTENTKNIDSLECITEPITEPIVKLGRPLGEEQYAVDVRGAVGFCDFLNGFYVMLAGQRYNGKPLFRSLNLATSTTPSFCHGNFLYLFFHTRNNAWVIGMKVNSGSGACAYFMGDAPSPEILRPRSSDVCWFVSMENGGFEPSVRMVCTRVSHPAVEPPPGFSMPSDSDGNANGRFEAESKLIDSRQGGDGRGFFVLRESTSVPDAMVLSVLLGQGDVNGDFEHVIITKDPDTRMLKVDAQYIGTMLQFNSLQDVRLHATQNGFIVRNARVYLTRCVQGIELFDREL